MSKSSSDFEDDQPSHSTFHGCYLLQSIQSRGKKKVYIGYCVDPDRRLRQHNSGAIYGGAKKTSFKGPWKMVAIVYGFCNQVSALRFEWAWQHPGKTTKIVARQKLKTESEVEYHLYLMALLVNAPPWHRLCLKVRFLTPEIKQVFDRGEDTLPSHVTVDVGEFDQLSAAHRVGKVVGRSCCACNNILDSCEEPVVCAEGGCAASYHLLCAYRLAAEDSRNEPDEYLIPIRMQCLLCARNQLWGSLVADKY